MIDMDSEWARINRATQFEEQLYRLLHEYILSFSVGKKDEVFYSFALDCNAIYNDVLPCFNTTEWLSKSIEHYQYETEKQIYLLKWNTGDWKYPASWKTEWKDLISKLQNEIEEHSSELYERYMAYVEDNDIEDMEYEDDWNARFMESVSKVAVRIEMSDAFRLLNKEHDFMVFACDHEEDVLDAIKRQSRLKRKWNEDPDFA